MTVPRPFLSRVSHITRDGKGRGQNSAYRPGSYKRLPIRPFNFAQGQDCGSGLPLLYPVTQAVCFYLEWLTLSYWRSW
jgi:hypothetical protein